MRISRRPALNVLITWINDHAFHQRSEICINLLASPTHQFYCRQPELLGSIYIQKKLLLESLAIQDQIPTWTVCLSLTTVVVPANTCFLCYLQYHFIFTLLAKLHDSLCLFFVPMRHVRLTSCYFGDSPIVWLVAAFFLSAVLWVSWIEERFLLCFDTSHDSRKSDCLTIYLTARLTT